MKFLTFIVIILMIPINVFANAKYPAAELTVKVIDYMGNPIDEAEVSIAFHINKGPNDGWGMTSKKIKGQTDSNGLFTGSENSSPYCGVSVHKDGYYSSGRSYEFKKRSVINRWEPWNPIIEVVLKKIKKAVPMYAKGTGYIKIPLLDKPVAYDLEKGDWVAPHGKGTVKDFIFLCKVRYSGPKEWECSYTLTFSNEKDGIQEYIYEDEYNSSYQWPYEAPDNGYKSTLTRMAFYSPDGKYHSEFDEKHRYIFRVRTVVDNDGKIIDAKYGKIKGDIEITRKENISFLYYFNPYSNRSLEYDTKNPLFKWSRREYAHEVQSP